MGQAHNCQGRGKIVVFANLRSELKAITEWSRRPQIFPELRPNDTLSSFENYDAAKLLDS
jgi:hypothetical protein